MAISKKLVVAVLAAVLVVLQDKIGLNLTEDQINGVAAIVAAYVFGQSAVDRKLIDNGKK